MLLTLLVATIGIVTYYYVNATATSQDKLSLWFYSKKVTQKFENDPIYIKSRLFSLSNSKELTPQARQDLVELIEEQSDFESRYQLALLLKELPSRPVDGLISLLEEAAMGGHLAAQYELGLIYNEQDEESISWLHESAEAGYVKSQLALGHYYFRLSRLSNFRERGFLSGAERLFEKAAQAGDAEGQYHLAQLYYYHRGKDVTEVWSLLESAANQGYPDAQYQLGKHYSNLFLELQDESKAIFWYQKAVDQGHLKAQVKMGNRYLLGSSVIKKNPEHGLKMLKLVAEQGDTEAMTLVGRTYFFDDGIPVNIEKAIEWLEKAVANENMHPLSGPSYAEQLLENVKNKAE